MVAVAKALADSARETKVLAIRGGILDGKPISGEDVEELAKLPPFDVLRGQVLAAIIAPLTSLLALVNAPLQNLVGLIDARIDQLGGEAPAAAEPEPVSDTGTVADTPEPVADAERVRHSKSKKPNTETQEAETDGGS